MVSPDSTHTASATETAGNLRRIRRELHEICAIAEPRFHEYISWAVLTVDAATTHVDGLAGVGPDFKLCADAAAAHVTKGRPGRESRNGPVTTSTS